MQRTLAKMAVHSRLEAVARAYELGLVLPDGDGIGRKRERAAGVGFEPTDELPRQQFSRLPDSTALAPRRPLSVCTSRPATVL